MQIRSILIPLDRKPVVGDIIKKILPYIEQFRDDRCEVGTFGICVTVLNESDGAYNVWQPQQLIALSDESIKGQRCIIFDLKRIVFHVGNIPEDNDFAATMPARYKKVVASNLPIPFEERESEILPLFSPDFIKEFVAAGCPEFISIMSNRDNNGVSIDSGGFVLASLIEKEKDSEKKYLSPVIDAATESEQNYAIKILKIKLHYLDADLSNYKVWLGERFDNHIDVKRWKVNKLDVEKAIKDLQEKAKGKPSSDDIIADMVKKYHGLGCHAQLEFKAKIGS